MPTDPTDEVRAEALDRLARDAEEAGLYETLASPPPPLRGTRRRLTAAEREKCFVCGGEKHPDTFDPAKDTGHNYWSTGEACDEAEEADRRTTVRYSTGETSPEELYVNETRGR